MTKFFIPILFALFTPMVSMHAQQNVLRKIQRSAEHVKDRIIKKDQPSPETVQKAADTAMPTSSEPEMANVVKDSVNYLNNQAVRNIRDLLKSKVKDSLMLNQLLNELDSTQKAIARKTLNDSIKAEKIKNENEQKLFESRLIAGASLGGLVLFLIFSVVLFRQRNLVRKEKAVAEMERNRSEELLLNILPASVALELKNTGEAKAKSFERISVLFTDFKSFTQHSEKISPEQLVAELNYCFKEFDAIIEKYHLEKVKTIGDSYMAASDLNIFHPDAVKNTLKAGIEMQQFIIQLKKDRESRGEDAFEMRVGIHTGPLVAGIVGKKKFAYDIWGDTVNTASRMESSGAPNQVNISEHTYNLVKNDPEFVFKVRGMVQAKGKGEMQMYFVWLASDADHFQSSQADPALHP